MTPTKPIIKYALYAIIAAVVIVGGFFIFKNNNTSQQAALYKTDALQAGARTIDSSLITRACNTFSSPWIQVTSPNGGEVYQAGQQITVTWKSCKIATTDNVQINLSDVIASIDYQANIVVTANDGQETFTLPSANVISGQRYKIGIWTVLGGGNPVDSDYSDNLFTINQGGVNCGNDPYAEVVYDRSEKLWHMNGNSSNIYSSGGNYNGYDNIFIMSSAANPNHGKYSIAAPFTVYSSVSCDITIKRLDLIILPPVNVSGMTGTFKVKNSLTGTVLGTATMPFNNSSKTVSIDLSANPIQVAASGNPGPKFIIEASNIDFTTPQNIPTTVAAFSFGLHDALMIDANGNTVLHKNYRTWIPVVNLMF